MVKRIQGTDGIRATTSLGKDLPGVSPLDAFLKHNTLTDEFVELYVYCYCRQAAPAGQQVVIGWDPRDTAGFHTDAAVRGIRRAGSEAVVIGVASTPAVSMYTVYLDAPAAVVVSASHNFKTQNGIKLFKRGGMKLLPADDEALTAAIVATSYAELTKLPLAGALTEASVDARAVFADAHADPVNSWVHADLRVNGPLVVDPANGALCGVAADVLRRVLPCAVREVNGDAASGNVNVDGGVADLEGVFEIRRGDLNFAAHASVQALLKERAGTAVVFDADGDRFYGLIYNAASDSVLVLSGDEAAIHIAAHLKKRGDAARDFVYTVESDLEAGRKAAELGFRPVLTGVGDKWLLRQAISDPANFAVACEASGHSITKGRLRRRDGCVVDCFAGNGLKAALNTLASIEGLSSGAIAAPFAAGHMKTFYVFYTRKQALAAGTPLMADLEAFVKESLRHVEGCSVERVPFAEEPDMLYMALKAADGTQRAGVFLRNSGTEEKTGVNVRGAKADAELLNKLGAALCLKLFGAMKDRAHAMSVAEEAVLRGLPHGDEAAAPTVPSNVHKERLLKEMVKGRLLQRAECGYSVTAFGRQCLAVSGRSAL